jgi:hypothetical protein
MLTRLFSFCRWLKPRPHRPIRRNSKEDKDLQAQGRG